jgi:endonuclease YncB( thermonuclease family)
LLYAIYGPDGVEGASPDTIVAERVRASDLRVIDGDTIEWQGTTYVLVGFDAPEALQAQCETERALGEAAASVLRSVILSGHEVELGVQSGTGEAGWEYARLWVSGEDVGARLIGQGLARAQEDGASQSWCGAG